MKSWRCAFSPRVARVAISALALFALISLYFIYPEVTVLVPSISDNQATTYSLRLELRKVLSSTNNEAEASPKHVTTTTRPFLGYLSEATDDIIVNDKVANKDLITPEKNRNVSTSERGIQAMERKAIDLFGSSPNNERSNNKTGRTEIETEENRTRYLRNLLEVGDAPGEGIAASDTSTSTPSATPVVTTTTLHTMHQHRQLYHVRHQKSQGFLIAGQYEQQLLGGFKGFYHLSRIASMLNLSTVEPYVQGTELYSIPIISKNATVKAAKLSHFYDLYRLRKALQFCTNGNNMVSFDYFLRKAPRQALFVVFLPILDHHAHHFKGDEKIVDIHGYTSQALVALGRLNSWSSFLFEQRKKTKKGAHHHRRKSFRKWRIILVDARPLHPLPWNELKTRLEGFVKQQVKEFGTANVIVPAWRDIKPPDMVSSFLYDFSGFEWDYCNNMTVIPHSEFVVNKTKRYIQSVNATPPIIGVHIRAERLLIDYPDNSQHLLDCIEELKELLKNGSLPNVPNENVHLFHDLSTYGTQTCMRSCENNYNVAISALENIGFKAYNYDPRSEPGYVLMSHSLAAFVDREYLSRADYLVTVGRGEYQDNIVNRFIQRSGREKLYRICNNKHPIPSCYPNC